MNDQEFEAIGKKVKPFLVKMRMGEEVKMSDAEKKDMARYLEERAGRPYKNRRLGKSVLTEDLKDELKGKVLTNQYASKIKSMLRGDLFDQLRADVEQANKDGSKVLVFGASNKAARAERKEKREAEKEAKAKERAKNKAKRESDKAKKLEDAADRRNKIAAKYEAKAKQARERADAMKKE